MAKTETKKLTPEQSADRQQLESRFKQALKGLGKSLELPPTPEPPANLFAGKGTVEMSIDDRRAIWELQQDMTILKARYNLIVKIAWRTSAALLGLAAPLIGSDLLSRIISLLGN